MEVNAIGKAPLDPHLDMVPARRRLLIARRDGDDLIVGRRLRRKGMRLNGTAGKIWLLCDGRRSVASIVAALRRSYTGTDDTLTQDVMATLHSLVEQGLLKLRKAPQKPWRKRRIDLRDLPFYVINCEADKLRREYMAKQLSELGLQYEFVAGTKCDPGMLGCAISHLRVLKQDRIKPPFVVLEDDCAFSDKFRFEFTVPAKADALYLGVSHWGTSVPGELSWGKYGAVQWSRYDATNLRVFNMLARHAVIYLTETFRQAAREANVNALAGDDLSFPGDVGMASIQPSHLVFTPLEPICYQDSKVGGDEGATKLPLGRPKR